MQTAESPSPGFLFGLACTCGVLLLADGVSADAGDAELLRSVVEGILSGRMPTSSPSMSSSSSPSSPPSLEHVQQVLRQADSSESGETDVRKMWLNLFMPSGKRSRRGEAVQQDRALRACVQVSRMARGANHGMLIAEMRAGVLWRLQQEVAPSSSSGAELAEILLNRLHTVASTAKVEEEKEGAAVDWVTGEEGENDAGGEIKASRGRKGWDAWDTPAPAHQDPTPGLDAKRLAEPPPPSSVRPKIVKENDNVHALRLRLAHALPALYGNPAPHHRTAAECGKITQQPRTKSAISALPPVSALDCSETTSKIRAMTESWARQMALEEDEESRMWRALRKSGPSSRARVLRELAEHQPHPHIEARRNASPSSQKADESDAWYSSLMSRLSGDDAADLTVS